MQKYLIFIAWVSFSLSCRPAKQNPTASVYESDGVVWAWGDIDIQRPNPTARVYITQSTETAQKSSLRLIMVRQGANSDSEIYDVTYVDQQISSKKLLAYTYAVSTQTVAGRADVLDIYINLMRAGDTYPGVRKLYLGRSSVGQNPDFKRWYYPIDLHEAWDVLKLTKSPFAKTWAVASKSLTNKILKDSEIDCDQTISEFAGQVRSQIPNYVASKCQTTLDAFCKQNPVDELCRDLADSKPAEATADPVSGLTKLAPGVYQDFNDDEDAVVSFTSPKISATSENNATQCNRRFFAVTRTLGGLANTACTVELAGSSPNQNNLRCAVRVKFDLPKSIFDKVCRVYGYFLDDPEFSAVIDIRRS